MRPLILNHEFPPAGGGAANASLEIARALAELGHDPVVLSSRHPKGTESTLNLPFPVHFTAPTRGKLESGSILEMICYIPAAFVEAIRLHRAKRFDCCLAFFSIPAGAVACALKLLCDLPYIVLLRGGDVPGTEPTLNFIHKMLTPVRRAIYRIACAVIANSNGLRELANKADPGFSIEVIPNGIDTNFFCPPSQPLPFPPFRILFVGRLHSQKNVDLLLKALAMLRNVTTITCHCDIVGDGPDRTSLQKLAEALFVDDLTTFHGWLDKNALLARYQTAHVFVNPSSYEGMPNTVLEAIACGLPVIASDVPGNRDVLQGLGKYNTLLDSCDAFSLCEALCKTLILVQGKQIEKAHEVKKLYGWHQAAESLLRNFAKQSL